MSINPQLRKIIKSYVIAAINLAGNDSKTKFPLNDPSGAPILSFVFLHDRLKQLPEYEKCLQALNADPTVSSQLDALIGINSRRSRSWTAEQIMIRLPHLGIYKNTIKFNEEFFDREYEAFERSSYGKTFNCEVIVPLSGPVFDKPIKIDDRIEICRVNRDDLSFPLEDEAEWVNKPYFLQPIWAIRTQYALSKIVGDDAEKSLRAMESDDEIRDKANETIEQVLICLRLQGALNVYPYTIVHRIESLLFQHVRPFPIKYFPPSQFSMELPKDFDKAFVKFWKNFRRAVKKHKFILSAAKRFSYAHERYNWEDRIIDLLIAGEATFLSQSKNRSNLSQRLKLHASIFLGNDAATKKQIFDDINFAYKLRSNIVHGSSKLDTIISEIKNREKVGFGEKYKLDEFTFRIQNYIRVAICKMVHLASQNNSEEKLVDWQKLIREDKSPKPSKT